MIATLSQVISPGCIFIDVPGTSKKKVLQNISQILSEYSSELDADVVFENLINRERLGSTGFGNGVAIPHCRLSVCKQITGAFFRLETPVDFDSVDNRPVDLVVVLLVPEEQVQGHLDLLSQIAEKLSVETTRSRLRTLQDTIDIHREFTQSSA
jgi:PTS system nitrogen regulatory IIA component